MNNGESNDRELSKSLKKISDNLNRLKSYTQFKEAYTN